MIDVSQLNLAICPEPNIPQKPAQTCNEKEGLRELDIHKVYKGKFKNVSSLLVPASVVKPTPVRAMMALKEQDVPNEWSWYNIGGNKIEDGSRNQSLCGCCWAMALISVLGDRYAIKYNIKSPKPSSVNLISCGGPDIGKNGYNGSISASRQCSCGNSCYAGSLWLEQGGSVGLEECFPFSLVSSKPYYPRGCEYYYSECAMIAPECSDLNASVCCDSDAAKVKFTVEKGSTKYLVVTDENNVVNPEATIRAIQLEIMGKGPVAATFWGANYFQDWWGNNAGSTEIYIPKVESTIGDNGHTVVLTGWGEEKGIKYWEMRNTWGSPGYCRFAMSTSIPKKFWTGIDVPTFINGTWAGGCISMEPGPLSDYKWISGKGEKPVGGGWIGEQKGKVNWRLLGIFIVVVLAIILLVSL